MEGIVEFFLDPANWQGSTGIPNRLFEHLVISGLAIAVATAIGLPVGLYIGHTGRGANLAINLANIGRAVPSYAVMVMILPLSLALAPVVGYSPTLGLNTIPILVAMTLLAIPPILVNAYAGLQAVDRELLESGRGMGLRERQILTALELPLASSVIVGGFRTATLQVIATATIGAILSGGGIGRFIVDGISLGQNGYPSIYAGAILVTVLAFGVDAVLSAVQRRLVPVGLRDPARATRRNSVTFDPTAAGTGLTGPA
ncbi:MAG TPA: ABC transporter permease [Candidatus Saccharimonadales bacterium]|nr:ABC transporter permease [Candidatus Saccharimonadales bacterium]